MLLFIMLGSALSSCAPAVPASSTTPDCDVKDIDVTDVRWFQEPDGAWRVVGMMHNHSSQPVSKVFMALLTRDKNDEPVFPDGPGGEDFSAYPFELLPGHQAPFSAWIKRELPNLDHFTVEEELCVTAEPVERLHLQERGGQLLVDDMGFAQVTLEVVNPGTKTALVNGAMVAVFDASDNLISAIDAEVTPRILGPGESGPVRATLALPTGGAAQIKSYKLYLDALATEPVSTLLNADKDIQVNAQYMDAYGQFHVVGQIINSGTKPIMVSVQAAVYTDSSKTAVVDSTFWDTIIPLAPGAKMPFDLTNWRVLNNKAGLWDTVSKNGAAVVLRVEPFRTWAADISIVPLKVTAEPPTFGAREAAFEGQIENNTARDVIMGTVTVTLRDKTNGNIVATGQTPLNITNALASGETLRYSVALPIEPGVDPENLQVEVSSSGQGT